MINFNISDLISRINVASRGHLKSVSVNNTVLTLRLLDVLYKNGVISYFKIHKDRKFIIVYLKYYQNKPAFYNLELVSKPSKRVYWTLSELSFNYSLNCFSQFYIIQLQRDC
jgi:ribosomal protein S8